MCDLSANQANGNTSDPTARGGVQLDPNLRPFTAISNNTFLHNRNEEETFKILIDVIRMRQEDTYNFEGDIMSGTIYNQEKSSASALRVFLGKAEQIPDFLPSWWTREKREECIQFGLRGPDHLLKCAQEKSDLQERWNDQQMPMKLRMLGEIVYGNTPGMPPGSRVPMLHAMKNAEDGTLQTTTLNMAQLFGSR